MKKPTKKSPKPKPKSVVVWVAFLNGKPWYLPPLAHLESYYDVRRCILTPAPLGKP